MPKSSLSYIAGAIIVAIIALGFCLIVVLLFSQAKVESGYVISPTTITWNRPDIVTNQRRGPRLETNNGYYSVKLEGSLLPSCASTEAALITVEQGICSYPDEETPLETLLDSNSFVRSDFRVRPSNRAYLGRRPYSTRGRYWIASWELEEIELGQFYQLGYRPLSVVMPKGSYALYRPSIESSEFYRHSEGEALRVPENWSRPYVIITK